ncbi:complex I subunit 4 family protein [Streptomyces coelicoflavus]|uniref:Proton-translocating NADH-quinone oxidoreductase n=1 Tax=Streptomyces albus (strain ATCC 21838 / DSM 41398 / FERM P-419 / JCM 4703 / NBRC 107858) TaxID=1081613 RepID=A0A0B5EHI5_STRA4|nr:proton-translocating NADH-quinone oxidoreductase [Streptomyces albus]AOU75974.1 proton-translocating NADH-quinone oxidoreductase subunit M [Streptomyces albus]AYN31776.1 oxidoreductase [Streptomyces albus]MCP8706811.1 NADH-quinone oxidoreductase subunit M [Streptomyces sp. AC04842]WDI21686.1 NADH-quinone oxidoreductase subunit M [Streptomyces enissocaesilis]
MLSVITFLPLAVCAVLLLLPSRALSDRACGWVWITTAAADLALVIALWADFDPRGGLQYEQRVRWIPSAGVGYHVGVDGLSLPLVALTCLLFLAVAVYSLHETKRVRSYVCLFLFLQTVSLGLFVALDLILFFVFFDLSIVGMFFVIAGWGHGERARAAALKFFLYTFIGSLALLLGFIGLYLAATPHTFDIVDLTRANPLAGRGLYAGMVLLAIGVGLAVKTPTVPFHTWLPPAHTDAPAAGSAILAGVLLKMGTYGFVRIAMPLLPGSWRHYALAIVIVGAVSVVYGALVALAQTDFKRMIAYTSVNHMGYIILAVGAAGTLAGSDAQARSLAVTGAVTQMVSHGLITGALFLLTGVLYDRGRTYAIDAYSGLAAHTPRFAAATAVAAFASLGIPGFSGFIAEFQIFTGSLASQTVATAIAVAGILITAALFLRALRGMFLGVPRLPQTITTSGIADLKSSEALSTVALLAVALVIGVAPRWLLDVIEPASHTVTTLVAR